MSSTVGTRRLGALALALLAAAALLSPLLGGGFLTDDFLVLSRLHGTSGPAETGGELRPLAALSRPALDAHQVYRPLVGLSFAANAALGGLEARWFLAANLLLHLLGGALLFLLVRRLVPAAPAWGTGAAVAWFLISPLQVESVGWTAARSETLSWIFGSLALLTKLGRPERCVLPASLAAVALLAKETALVFFVLLPLVDLLPPNEGQARSDGASRRRAALRTAAPLLFLGLLYLAARWWVFGGIGGVYGSREIAPRPLPELVASWGRSLVTTLVPIGRGALGDGWGWTRAPLAALLVAGQLLLWAGGLRAATMRPRGLLVLLVSLFAIPYLIGVSVNEIDGHLVNSRAAYTPLASCALLLALASSSAHPVLARGPAVLLLACSALLVVPTARSLAGAGRDTETTLATLRAAISETAPGATRLAVLGYREDDYLGGGFTLSGALPYALKPPFVDRAIEVLLVRLEVADPAHPHLTPWPEIAAADGRTLALAALLPGITDSPRRYELVHEGAFAAIDGAAIRLDEPTGNTVLSHDTRLGETFAPSFRFATRGLDDPRFSIRLFCPTHRKIEDALPAAALSVRDEPPWTLYDLALPVPDSLMDQLREFRSYAWAIAATDAEGNRTAVSGLDFLRIRLTP